MKSSVVRDIGILIRKSMVRLSPSQKNARAIMGKNFLGIKEAIPGVNPTAEELAILSKVPFSEFLLRLCSKTHILVAKFPFSILDIRDEDLDPDLGRTLMYSHEDAWYNTQRFAKKRGKPAWHLVRKEPVEFATLRSWGNLTHDEETPDASIMAYTIIGHFLNTGEWLMQDVMVRCADPIGEDRFIHVGSPNRGGLHIHHYRDDECKPLLLARAVRQTPMAI